jgi:hypothetical protein
MQDIRPGISGAAYTPVMSGRPPVGEHWVPENPDGSGWAEVDWASAIRGSRYHYRHGDPAPDAEGQRSPWYRVVTRLETPNLHAPHENSYWVPASSLSDFLAELTLAGGDEQIWHIEACPQPPPEARVSEIE